MPVPTTTVRQYRVDEAKDEHPTRNKVERQVHQIADEGLGAELVKRTLQDLAEFVHGIASVLELSPLEDQLARIPRNHGAVKRIQQCILHKVRSCYHVDNGRALAQDKDDGREDGEWAIDKHHYGELWHVGEHEH